MTKYMVMCFALILMAILPGCDALNELTDDTEKPQEGTIEGTVALESGTDHGGVIISVKETNIKTTSKSDGSFQLPDVPKGINFVSFELEGFVSADKEVEVIGGETTNVDVSLEREIPMPPTLPNP